MAFVDLSLIVTERPPLAPNQQAPPHQGSNVALADINRSVSVARIFTTLVTEVVGQRGRSVLLGELHAIAQTDQGQIAILVIAARVISDDIPFSPVVEST